MRATTILGIFGFFLLLYLAFSGSSGWSEVTVGSAAALATVFFVRRLRKHFGRPLNVKASWFLFLLRIPWAMLQETAVILLILLRRLTGRGPEGKFIDYPYRGEKDDAYDPMRRAFMAWGVCITPNSYLIDYDGRRRKLLIRQLAGDELSRTDRVFVELP